MSKLKGIAVGRKDLFMVDPKDIKIDPNWNKRTKNEALEDHINGLSASIAEIGVQQPITVRPVDGEYFVTDGFCRMEAVARAITRGVEIKSVPVRTEERYSNEADHVLSMLVRNDGKPLTAIEQARVVKRLMALGWTDKMVRERTGKSAAHVANLVLLNSAHPEIIQIVEAERISTNLVIEELKKNRSGDEALTSIKRMVAKAEASGKKATKRTVKEKSVPWAKHGPVLHKHMKGICDKFGEIEGDVPDELGDLIMAAVDVVGAVK